MGILEYISQTSGNFDFIEDDVKYKFIDDASILEEVNLKEVGLCSYYYHQHVPSDVPIDSQWIPPTNLQSQQYLDKISEWTKCKKMQLNVDKTKLMIVNYTQNYQFRTRLSIDGAPIEIVEQTKLLGTIISSDLKWEFNTKAITQRAYARMRILHKLNEYNVPTEDMVLIYILYIRSVCEQSAVVWHSSLTMENTTDLERVQKTALKIILKNNYLYLL